MEPNSVKVYVLKHLEGVSLNLPPLYTYLMTGKTGLQSKSNMLGDDSDVNISERNRYYSELTGIYWIWKNRQHDVIGTCHYRRFFTAQPESFLYNAKQWFYSKFGLNRTHFGLIHTLNIQLYKNRILSTLEINDLLERYDAILPLPRKLKRTVKKHYVRCHDSNDLIILRNIIKEKHPAFTPAFDEVLQSKRMYANNMFVLRKELFDEFMTWWFDILFEFEKQIDLKTKTGYQERILGFVAERLLNVWFAHKKLNVVELPVIYFKKFKKVEEYNVPKAS